MKRIALFAILALLTVQIVVADEEKVVPINKNKDGVAIEGYDPVAYFEEGKAMKGKKEFKSKWMDAEWMFTTAVRRDLFDKSPTKYAPQYGGYCAFGMTKGQMVAADETVYRILSGKLYLCSSKDSLAMFEKDTKKNISLADENYQRIIKTISPQ